MILKQTTDTHVTRLFDFLLINLMGIIGAGLICMGFGFWIGVLWRCFEMGFISTGGLWK